jgi:hypothetical protein
VNALPALVLVALKLDALLLQDVLLPLHALDKSALLQLLSASLKKLLFNK